MSKPIHIRMGGYGPPTTGFSRAMKFIGDRLQKEFGDRIVVKYVWNIMDFGYRADDIWWLVEDGILSLGYQSSSYLTDRVPELSFVDLPFLFADNKQARDAMDGALGKRLAQAMERRIGPADGRLPVVVRVVDVGDVDPLEPEALKARLDRPADPVRGVVEHDAPARGVGIERVLPSVGRLPVHVLVARQRHRRDDEAADLG